MGEEGVGGKIRRWVGARRKRKKYCTIHRNRKGTQLQTEAETRSARKGQQKLQTTNKISI